MLLIETRRAVAGDWPAVRELLTEAGLPLDGAVEALTIGVVSHDGDRLVGCAAIEPYEAVALLRSVAVVPDRRRTGLGTSLVRAAEDLARDRAASRVVLLTETAESWFRRLGYVPIERSSVPTDVADSVEFRTACSASAIAMGRTLG